MKKKKTGFLPDVLFCSFFIESIEHVALRRGVGICVTYWSLSIYSIFRILMLVILFVKLVLEVMFLSLFLLELRIINDVHKIKKPRQSCKEDRILYTEIIHKNQSNFDQIASQIPQIPPFINLP